MKTLSQIIRQLTDKERLKKSWAFRSFILSLVLLVIFFVMSLFSRIYPQMQSETGFSAHFLMIIFSFVLIYFGISVLLQKQFRSDDTPRAYAELQAELNTWECLNKALDEGEKNKKSKLVYFNDAAEYAKQADNDRLLALVYLLNGGFCRETNSSEQSDLFKIAERISRENSFDNYLQRLKRLRVIFKENT